MKTAVCYTASDGYMFQTVVSAAQARRQLPSDAEVVVIHVGAAASAEVKDFAKIGEAVGVRVTHRDLTAIQGLHPIYARLFLASMVPEFDEFLYLDGDTQVVGDLAPLTAKDTMGQVLGVRDPMVMTQYSTSRLHSLVNSWWDESGIPASTRTNYLNSGVLRASASTLDNVRTEALRLLAENRRGFRFLDQDLINRVSAGIVTTLSPRWNFPGFLLGTNFSEQIPPVIVHFMSDPRPWEHPYRPWGTEYYGVYEQFVADHPTARPYWRRATKTAGVRYSIQQYAKHLHERPRWQALAGTEHASAWSEGEHL